MATPHGPKEPQPAPNPASGILPQEVGVALPVSQRALPSSPKALSPPPAADSVKADVPPADNRLPQSVDQPLVPEAPPKQPVLHAPRTDDQRHESVPAVATFQEPAHDEETPERSDQRESVGPDNAGLPSNEGYPVENTYEDGPLRAVKPLPEPCGQAGSPASVRGGSGPSVFIAGLSSLPNYSKAAGHMNRVRLIYFLNRINLIFLPNRLVLQESPGAQSSTSTSPGSGKHITAHPSGYKIESRPGS